MARIGALDTRAVLSVAIMLPLPPLTQTQTQTQIVSQKPFWLTIWVWVRVRILSTDKLVAVNGQDNSVNRPLVCAQLGFVQLFYPRANSCKKSLNARARAHRKSKTVNLLGPPKKSAQLEAGSCSSLELELALERTRARARSSDLPQIRVFSTERKSAQRKSALVVPPKTETICWRPQQQQAQQVMTQ